MGSYASNYHQEHERLSLPSRPCWLLLVQHAVAWEAEAEQKLSSSAASGIPDDPLRGMPCLPVRPWCRAPAPAGMALARPTKVRRRRRTFAFSMLPYVPD